MKSKPIEAESLDWANAEFENAKFKDERIKKRIVHLAARFSESPECSINQACKDWSETKAAYRFFKNDNVSASEILESHIQKTAERAKAYPTVLAIQDSSYFQYGSHTKTTGLGIISSQKSRGKDLIFSGLVMHTSFAVTTDGLPLGILDQRIFTRKPREEGVKKLGSRQRNLRLKTEDKDSYRWVVSLNKSAQALSGSGCRVVTVGDREADIYELFAAAHCTRTSFLVRQNVDRCINRRVRYPKTCDKLLEFIKTQKSQGKILIEIPSRGGRRSREAVLDVSFGAVKVTPPRDSEKWEKLPPLYIHAIHAVEKHPPKNEEPIDWILLTDLEIAKFDDAIEKLNWYCFRWRIEIFHKILKSGLRVEDCRLESAERLTRYLSVMSIIAWRLYLINLIGRTQPSRPCTDLLAEQEWKVLYSSVYRTSHIPKHVPTLNEAIHLIARLGGFLDRKGDGEPGAQTIWKGWRRLCDIEAGWNLAFAAMKCG